MLKKSENQKGRRGSKTMWEQKSEKVSSLKDTEHDMAGHGWLDGDTDTNKQEKKRKIQRLRERETGSQTNQKHA